MTKKVAIAIHAWQGDGGGKRCLTFEAGDRIKVIEAREAGGWWAGSLDGRQGWFPSSFCRVEDEPDDVDLLDISGASPSSASKTPLQSPLSQQPQQQQPSLIGEPLATSEAKPAAANFFGLELPFGKKEAGPAGSTSGGTGSFSSPPPSAPGAGIAGAVLGGGGGGGGGDVGFAASVSDFVGGDHSRVSGNSALDRRLQACKLGHKLTPAAGDGGRPQQPAQLPEASGGGGGGGAPTSGGAPSRSHNGRPIWQSLTFIDLFADVAGGAKAALGAAEAEGYERKPPRGLNALGASMRLLVRVLTVLSKETSAAASVDGDLGGVAGPLPELESVAAGLRLGMELLSLQQPHQEHAGLLAYLEQLLPMVTQLPVHGELVVPAAWDRDGAAFLLVLHRSDEGSFNVAVCNWGPGIDRHPVRLHASTGGAQRTPCLDLRGVPRERLIDSGFWFVLFRMVFLPQAMPRGPPLLYDTLLPALTDMPALSHAATAHPDQLRWHAPPLSGDLSHAALAMAALEGMLCARGFSPAQAACKCRHHTHPYPRALHQRRRPRPRLAPPRVPPTASPHPACPLPTRASAPSLICLPMPLPTCRLHPPPPPLSIPLLVFRPQTWVCSCGGHRFRSRRRSSGRSPRSRPPTLYSYSSPAPTPPTWPPRSPPPPCPFPPRTPPACGVRSSSSRVSSGSDAAGWPPPRRRRSSWAPPSSSVVRRASPSSGGCGGAGRWSTWRASPPCPPSCCRWSSRV